MKTILIFCIVVLGYMSLSAQNVQLNPPPVNNDKVYSIVQSKPNFNGDLSKWLADNIVYPKDARDANIQGTVYISFVVEKNGSVSTVKVMRGVQGGRSLENEAVRVVSAMPAWTPGMQDGNPVRVQYNLPIRFVLQNNNATQHN
jgi:periplasmic protein TonB